MKKRAVAATWVLAFSLVVLIFNFDSAAEASASLPDRSLSFAVIANNLQSPEALETFLRKNFSYEKDRRNFGKEDYWQTPEEFLANGKGDCEDFARFAYEILKQNGISASLMSIYSKRFGHMVCIFKKDGRYFVVDGNHLKSYEVSNLKDLAGKIYPFWTKASLLKASSDCRKAEVLATITK